MITLEQAREYARLLHPAFAGYYHDGMVTESDALAAVFQLIKKGCIEPEFSDNNINRGIRNLRKNAKKSPVAFERKMIQALFYESDYVSTKYVGNLIRQGVIQTIIHGVIAASKNRRVTPIDMKLLDDVEVTTLETQERRIVNVVSRFKPPYWIYIVFFVVLAFMNSDSSMEMTFFILAAVIALFAWLFKVRSSKILYSHVVVQPLDRRYSELHDFLDALPPRPHDFTYEFIPYAIAFNIDRSWLVDFGLERERYSQKHHVRD